MWGAVRTLKGAFRAADHSAPSPHKNHSMVREVLVTRTALQAQRVKAE
jgi:hypothetical protein